MSDQGNSGPINHITHWLMTAAKPITKIGCNITILNETSLENYFSFEHFTEDWIDL